MATCDRVRVRTLGPVRLELAMRSVSLETPANQAEIGLKWGAFQSRMRLATAKSRLHVSSKAARSGHLRSLLGRVNARSGHSTSRSQV